MRIPIVIVCLCVLGLRAHAEGPTLQVQKTGLGAGLPHDLQWTADPAFPSYASFDVISGDLATLRASGDFAAAVTSCLVNDASSGPLSGLPVPPMGGQWFFLVRAQESASSCGDGSWNEALSKGVDRDASIPTAPATCPCP